MERTRSALNIEEKKPLSTGNWVNLASVEIFYNCISICHLLTVSILDVLEK